MTEALQVTSSTPSVLLAWFVLGAVAVVGFALQCLWILVLRPILRWLGRY